MINKFILGIFGFCFLITSCKKETPGYVENDLKFNASLSVDSVALGDTANFFLTDNPDFISFYSGELGHQYLYKDRTILFGGSLKVKFETRIQNQPADSSLDVLISTDFNGIYDSAGVASANWKLISNQFVFPNPSATLSVFYPSGQTNADFADLTDSVIPGQPFYFAYRYSNKNPSSIIWSIGKLGMYNVFPAEMAVPNATVIDSNQITSGSFAGVKIGDTLSRWSTSSTYLKCTNSSLSPTGAQYWYISRPLNPSAVAPDAPIVIKNITQNPLNQFKYKYNQPGVYKATFVASYHRLNFEKTIIKEVNVIVN